MVVHHISILIMSTKMKAVVNAERQQIERIERLVQAGAYASVSAFMREAVDEKLERLRETRLAEQVGRYAVAGYGREDGDLVAVQDFSGVKSRQRAKR